MLVVNDIVLRQGGYFTDRRDEEVIVNDAFARRHSLHPGDRLVLLLNNRRQELYIVGTACSSEFVYLVDRGGIAPDPEHFGVFYLKQRYLEEVFDFRGACNQAVGLLAPAVRDHPDELLRRMEDRLAAHGVYATTPRREHVPHRFLNDYIHEISTMASVMPMMFLVVGVLVLSMLLTRLTEQQRTVIGTLQALGYTDRQVLLQFLKLGLAVGLAGALAGFGLGWWLSHYLTTVYRQFFEFPELVNRIYPGTYATGLLVSVTCALAGAGWGARGVLRLEPAVAMRPQPPARGGPILLERLGWLWRRLGTGWRMVLRHLFRQPIRSLVGVFAAMMGAALVVYGLLINNSWTYLVDHQFQQVLRSDVDLTFMEEHGADALREARQLPGVRHAEPVLNVACTLRHGTRSKRGSITGLIPGARLTVPRYRDGRPLHLPEAGLAMNRTLADILHVAPGDRISVEPIRGRREPCSVPVLEIVDGYLGMDVYADIHYLSRLVHEEIAVTGVQLEIEPGAANTRTLYRELKQLPALQTVSARRDILTNLVETLVKGNRVGTVMMVLFAGVIFFSSTLNAALIALAERRGEVATLLMLGYGRWSVGGLFLRESLLVNLAGTLLGLPLGYLLFRGMSFLFNTELVRLPLRCPPSLLVVAVLLSLVFTLLAHGFVQQSIHRLDLLERARTQD